MVEFVSLKIEVDKMLGKMFKALVRNEDLNISLTKVDKEGNNNRPDYSASDNSCAVWIKESKFN